MVNSFILSGARTPIGSFQGNLARFSAPELGGMALKAAIKQAAISPESIDEVIMGCVLSAGLGQAPARQAAKLAGIPNKIGAITINKVCGSSLKAVVMADQMIRANDANIIAAGGMESMSNAPYLLPKVREGLRLGHGEVIDSMIHDGLWDPYNNFHMGNAGDRCAKNSNISREDQDAYAKRSYERALAALEQGRFKREIVALEFKNQKTGEMENISEDEEIRKGASRLSKMSSLKSAFSKDGTVTAANSAKINDGGAAIIVASQKKANELGLKPRFRIVGFAQSALSPEDFPIAPISAIRNLSEKLNIKLNQVDRYEINEAFSVVAEVAIQQLKLDPERVNARGGAVALGHPIGASGARILITLMHQLEDENLKQGIAAICLGGGEAVALMIERL